MKINDAFPSKYLKADDLNGDTTFTIAGVKLDWVGQDADSEQKPVVAFHETSQLFVLNKTNANTIIDVLGTDETDSWVGRRITLFATRVEFGGKRVPAIRVRDSAEIQALADDRSQLQQATTANRPPEKPATPQDQLRKLLIQAGAKTMEDAENVIRFASVGTIGFQDTRDSQAKCEEAVKQVQSGLDLYGPGLLEKSRDEEVPF